MKVKQVAIYVLGRTMSPACVEQGGFSVDSDCRPLLNAPIQIQGLLVKLRLRRNYDEAKRSLYERNIDDGGWTESRAASARFGDDGTGNRPPRAD